MDRAIVARWEPNPNSLQFQKTPRKKMPAAQAGELIQAPWRCQTRTDPKRSRGPGKSGETSPPPSSKHTLRSAHCGPRRCPLLA